MIRNLHLLPVLALALGCTSVSARTQHPLEAMQTRVIEISEKVTPAVVHIEAAVKQNNRRNVVSGSGFVVDASGIVLTNEHVVERAEKVSVIVPNRPGRYPAEVVGSDKQTDVAVLRVKLEAGDPPLPVAELGDSDAVKVGEWVIAIGNPYGLDGTVSLGIVSAKGRNLSAAQLLNDFIQTDAMIDRGSSGGPLIDLDGKVIGINSRGQGRGIGFTIPINLARRVSQELLGQGQATRAYLGIAIQPLSRELARYWQMPDTHGVIVNGIVHDSPAERAGFQVGDIITTFDGRDVRAEKDEDTGSFQRMVAQSDVGKTVDVEIVRSGSREWVAATLAPQPSVVPDEEETDFGFTVQEITEKLFRQHRLDDREGVLVSFVERGTAAAEAGMTHGDLIQEIEGQPVRDIQEFRSALGSLAPGRPFLVRARRGLDLRFLLIVPRSQDRTASAEEGDGHG